MNIRLALATALALTLAACGDPQSPPHQPQTASAASHKAGPEPVGKRDTRQRGGPVYDGQTY